MHHEAVEKAREVAGGACLRDLLHAQEYPVLSGLPRRPKSFVFAPKKPCNRPRIAIMCSALSDQLLHSRNGSQEERSILRTACTTRSVMAFTMSKPSVA